MMRARFHTVCPCLMTYITLINSGNSLTNFVYFSVFELKDQILRFRQGERLCRLRGRDHRVPRILQDELHHALTPSEWQEVVQVLNQTGTATLSRTVTGG